MEDEALGAALLASAKNTEEHAYAVASMREALEPLCDELDSQSRPTLLKLPNLQHLGTWVRGTLTADGTPRSALGLAAAVHPYHRGLRTPTGAAFDFVRDSAHGPGAYPALSAGSTPTATAVGHRATLCPAFRRTAAYSAGCGIVAGSIPPAEAFADQVKFLPMRGALEG